MENKTPRLRFKCYTDDWERSKAGALFVEYSDKGHPDLPVLSATQDMGMVNREEYGKVIFHDKNNEYGYKRVLPGQYVIHLRSFQGGFAHSSIEGITSPAYTVFGHKDTEKHNNLFWKYIFCSEDFKHRLETVTYGIRDGKSISYDEFLDMDFTYPSNAEQMQIAKTLVVIDNLINLHQRKYEKLIDVKKSLLDKMFPAEGETVPRIRFSGYVNDWDQCKLNSISYYVASSLTSDDCDEQGRFDLYDANGVIGKTNKNIQEQDYITIIKDGSGVGRVRKLPKNTAFIGTMGSIKPINSDFDFLYCILSRFDFSQYTYGAAIPHVYFSEYGEEVVAIPQIREQVVIGQIINKIDDLIALYQCTLEKLNNIKKSLLERMFV